MARKQPPFPTHRHGRHNEAVTRSATELMDAALQLVAESGLTDLTLTDVARRAGVSRATTYREFGDKDGLVAALVRREIGTMIAAAYQEVDMTAPTPELARTATLFALRYLRAHEAFRYIRGHEPQWLLNAAVTHMESERNLVETVAALLTPLLSLRRAGDLSVTPEQAAEIIVRTVLSHILVERSTLSDDEIAAMVVRATSA
ncbi:HTH-type transcriptional regulator BetI [Nocardia cerradoensis]|uniref:HTH-type transcriptional regulator BetI n=1 Tax=Nocardia cerradoensis TaxID=85688 RepID=A0A231H3N4_9NOCA|nr:TetR/AcrR family transcriptional regulator [Nocardia cerradoensis]OXR43445.1 HTH-type transcriptional regulator BetI [Nocardia cerradoensis]